MRSCRCRRALGRLVSAPYLSTVDVGRRGAVGLVLAMHSANPDLSTTIREGSQGAGHGARTARLRNLLIVAEISLAVVLMTGAGLLLRTFWNLLRENPGFNPANVVTASIWLPPFRSRLPPTLILVT